MDVPFFIRFDLIFSQVCNLEAPPPNFVLSSDVHKFVPKVFFTIRNNFFIFCIIYNTWRQQSILKRILGMFQKTVTYLNLKIIASSKK